MRDLKTIILAAGKGTRMKSSVPKVLHPVCGQPMIEYVLEVAKKIGSLKTAVVLGHQFDSVKKQLPTGVIAIRQKKLLGTADAVRSAASFLKGHCGDVLILCGDTPLLTESTIKKLLGQHQRAKAVCTVLTATVENPSGYGRIIRNRVNQVLAIREDKDASAQEKLITEINTGVYCFRCPDLLKTLQQIKLNAKKKDR